MVRDLIVMLLAALAGALVACVPGALLLRRLHRRSITLNILVLQVITVLAVLAGVLAVAAEMFISTHDLHVVLIVVPLAGFLGLAMAWWAGKRMTRAAVWAEDAREEARKKERQIVAWVSHDLRTPLAGMRAMAEALEDGVVSDPATVAEYYRRLRTETDRMASLVDDLFELSRINSGALSLTLTQVALGDVVSDAVAAAEPLARSHGIRLVSTTTQWPQVTASAPELSRIVANLLLNAIRYTPSDGTVTVTGGSVTGGSVTGGSVGGGSLRPGARPGAWLAVADTCGGIADTDLPRVFDVAFRGNGKTALARTPGSNGGGGLGLAIVRGLVEAHGGHVAVENITGGCRFTVQLPY